MLYAARQIGNDMAGMQLVVLAADKRLTLRRYVFDDDVFGYG